MIVIHHGVLLFDGDLSGLVARFAPHKTIILDLERDTPDAAATVRRALEGTGGHVTEQTAERIALRVPRTHTAAVTTRLLAELSVLDLVVEEPPIDEVIDQVFAGGTADTAESAEAARAATDAATPADAATPR